MKERRSRGKKRRKEGRKEGGRKKEGNEGMKERKKESCLFFFLYVGLYVCWVESSKIQTIPLDFDL
jgi:hypothetical protein